MEQAGAHMSQHLQKIANDPTRKAEVKKKQLVLTKLGKQTDQLQQQVQEMEQSQNGQNGQGPSPEEAKAHADIIDQAKKTDADIQRKNRTAAVKDRLSDKKTAADIQRKNKSATVKNRVTEATTASDIHRKTRAHRHDLSTDLVSFLGDQSRAQESHQADLERADQESAAKVAALGAQSEEEPTE
jgi:hypothetical protein